MDGRGWLRHGGVLAALVLSSAGLAEVSAGPPWSAASSATSLVVAMSGWPLTAGSLGCPGGGSGRSLELFSPAEPCPWLVPTEGELSYKSVLALGHVLHGSPGTVHRRAAAPRHAVAPADSVSGVVAVLAGALTAPSVALQPVLWPVASLTWTPGSFQHSWCFPAPKGLSQPFPDAAFLRSWSAPAAGSGVSRAGITCCRRVFRGLGSAPIVCRVWGQRHEPPPSPEDGQLCACLPHIGPGWRAGSAVGTQVPCAQLMPVGDQRP